MTSLREVCAAPHHRYGAVVLVLAPTGRVVDAVREGAGDEGFTIAKALQDLRSGTLTLDRGTLVMVNEAAMVGTDDLRQLLTATTSAG